MILVVVLWALVVLSALAASYAIATRTYTRATFHVSASARLAAVSEAGINRAILELSDSQRRANRDIDGLLGISACRFGQDVLLAIRVQDEAGKIDLNYGDERLLRRLIAATGVSDSEAGAIVDRIVDFRDSDELRRPSGAEVADYRAAGLDYGPANREFLSIDELEQVLHMPVELVAAIRPFVTVRSHLTGIDPEVSDPSLLAALSGRMLAEAAETSLPPGPGKWDALGLPAELRMHTSSTTYSVTAASSAKSGGLLVRETTVDFHADGTFSRTAWQAGVWEPLPSVDQVMPCR